MMNPAQWRQRPADVGVGDFGFEVPRAATSDLGAHRFGRDDAVDQLVRPSPRCRRAATTPGRRRRLPAGWGRRGMLVA